MTRTDYDPPPNCTSAHLNTPAGFCLRVRDSVSTLLRVIFFFALGSGPVCRHGTHMYSALGSLEQCAAVTLCNRNLLFLLYGDYNVNMWQNDTTGSARHAEEAFFFLSALFLRNFYGPGSYIRTCI